MCIYIDYPKLAEQRFIRKMINVLPSQNVTRRGGSYPSVGYNCNTPLFVSEDKVSLKAKCK